MLGAPDHLSFYAFMMCMLLGACMGIAFVLARVLRRVPAIGVVRVAAVLLWLLLTVSRAFRNSGQAYVLLQIVTILLLWTWCAVEVSHRRGSRRVAFWAVYVGVCALLIEFMEWRGITAGGIVSPDYHFGFAVMANSVWVPAAVEGLAVVSSEVFWSTLWGLTDRVLWVMTRYLPVGVTVANLGLAWYSVRLFAPREDVGAPLRLGRGRIRYLMAALLPLCLLLQALFAESLAGGIAAWAIAVAAPLYLFEGARLVYVLMASLRTRRLAFSLLVLSAAFLPAVGIALFFLGYLVFVVHVPLPTGEQKATGAGLSRGRLVAGWFVGGLGASLVLKALLLPSYAMLRDLIPSLEAGPAVCATLTHAPTPDGSAVFYEGPGIASFSIDVHEYRDAEGGEPRAVRTRSEAAALCEARGARLCGSDEWYLACGCGYESVLDTAHLTVPGSQHPWITRWWQPPQAPWDLIEASVDEYQQFRPDTVSEHGVVGLVGGVSEVLGYDLPGDGLVFAGANSWIVEDVFTDCRFRGTIAEASLARHDWPFVGFRCCRTGEAGP